MTQTKNLKQKSNVRRSRKTKAVDNIDRSAWPVMAICYDFDKTLSKKDMQEYALFPSLGITDALQFWQEAKKFAVCKKMDPILAYMYLIVHKTNNAMISRKVFIDSGKNIELFNGVRTWFKRIRDIADTFQIRVEHYVISAGIKEIIMGTSISKEFKEIYACSFLYDNEVKEYGRAVWPTQVVNATTKTQYLFRINKGCTDLGDDSSVHKTMPKDLRPIPFDNMVYIGDSVTDIPAMRIVKSQGGYSLGVYNPDEETGIQTMHKLMSEDRIDYYAPADYSKNGELEKIITDIIHGIKLKEQSKSQRITLKTIVENKSK